MSEQSSNPPMIELPRYRCHKEVWALKIAGVITDHPGPVHLGFEDRRYGAIEVPRSWFERHKPEPGGYLVQYADGYRSYSPGPQFEAGYLAMNPIQDGCRLLHQSVQHVLGYFKCGHLPAHLRTTSQDFADLASITAMRNPDSPETTIALRKLLEAKDAAVRAAL